jgi:hypothetical protein
MIKEAIVISRQWNNPKIHAYMTKKGVGSEMELDDFLTTLLEIVGSPTLTMTRKQLAAKVFAAKEQIVNEMKKATVHV